MFPNAVMVVFLILLIAGIVFFLWRLNVINSPVSPLQPGVVEVAGSRIAVQIAETAAGREQGLSGRDGLQENEGMLFLFNAPGRYGFWMKDMKFPIDILWIKESVVVGFRENIDPQIGVSVWRLELYYPEESIDAALEMRAGEIRRLNIKKGDEVRVKR